MTDNTQDVNIEANEENINSQEQHVDVNANGGDADAENALKTELESLKKQNLGLRQIISNRTVRKIFGGNDEQSLNDRKRFEELDQTVRDDILKFCQNNDFSPKAADAFVRHEMRMVDDAKESDRRQQEQVADYQNKVNQLKATDAYKTASSVIDGFLANPKLSTIDTDCLRDVFENPSAKIAVHNLVENVLMENKKLMENVNQDVAGNTFSGKGQIDDNNFDGFDEETKLAYAFRRSMDAEAKGNIKKLPANIRAYANKALGF